MQEVNRNIPLSTNGFFVASKCHSENTLPISYTTLNSPIDGLEMIQRTVGEVNTMTN